MLNLFVNLHFNSPINVTTFYSIAVQQFKRSSKYQYIRQILIIQIVNSNMQKSFYPKTPQKSNISKSTKHDQHLLKGLSPHLLTVGSSGFGKPKLQMMHSPIPVYRDLFSQLIQTQRKLNCDEYYNNYQILEEEDSFQIIDDLYVQECTQQHDSNMLDENDQDSDENGIKKRKRKSTAQIKILKYELQNESNWSKQKIAEMSETTGLSQSQVYKWWWDQKKKNAKYEKEISSNLFAKKKLIKKDFCKRKAKKQADQNSEDEYEQQILTKPKNVIELQQVPETEKKVNKRLTFL